MELFQLGTRLPAEEAQAMGLITRVVSVGLGEHVQAVLEQLNQFSPAAVRQTKDLMRQAQEPSVSLQRIIDLELGVFKSLLGQRLAQK